MKLSQKSLGSIEAVLKRAIEKYNGDEQTIVTDIHCYPNPVSGELFIYDDDEEELANTTVPEWIGIEDENFFDEAAKVLRTSLSRMKDAGSFSKLTLLKPYSFVLVDDDKETVEELLLMDDDTMLLHTELLQGLDKDLDNFLKKLLED